MIQSYFKIAIRNLRKNPGYTSINIIGLATGLAACLLIAVYVQDELSYDNFHANADRTYRVLREFDIPDLHTTIETTPSALAPAIVQGVPGIEAAVRVSRESPVVARGSHKYVETSFIAADSNFFDVFTVPIVSGRSALNRPGTVTISEAIVEKYFPGEDPIGQFLLVGDTELEVTGITQNVPLNSHLRFDFVTSLDAADDDWGRNNMWTYVMLFPGQNKVDITATTTELIRLSTDPNGVRTGSDFIPHLQELRKIHLGQGVSVDIGSEGNIFYVYLFIGLAFFIILLACINFVNLSTARSVQRSREVGMRKTLGGSRSQLTAQFLGESLLTTVAGFGIALLLCRMALPLLNDIAVTSLSFDVFFTTKNILIFTSLIVVVGLVAGAYPAMVLSRFNPITALKGREHTGGSSGLRSGLVVFQFATSVALLVGTGVVQNQLQYMKSTGLGFNSDNIAIIEGAGFLGNQREAFEQQIASLPGVDNVSASFSVPGTFYINSMWQPAAEDGQSAGDAQNLDYTFIDFDFIESLEIEMVAGRSISQSFASDSMAVVLNETAVSEFGWSPEEAVGKRISQGRSEYTIVGVARDFHFRSLRSSIYSLAMFGPRRPPRYIVARLSPGAMPTTILSLENIWAQFSELPFEYSFLADDLGAQYASEDRLAKVFGLFAGLAVLIGCMGLFGLSSYMTLRRTKEIGVRKILGASVGGLIGLLSKDYLKLVIIAFVVAAPLAYLGMNWWLETFAYRVSVDAQTIAAAGILAVTIALVTVSFQAVRTARSNPVDSLRYE